MAGDFARWAETELRAADGDVRRKFERTADGPSMSALQVTGSTDPDHTDRLMRALGHDPKDAR
jgi:hypothetical protein